MSWLRSILKRIGFRLLIVFAWASVLTFFAWGVGALYYLATIPKWLGVVLAMAYASGAVVLFRRTADKSKWLSIVAASVIVIYVVTLTQRPSNDRDWVEAQSRLPKIEIDGDDVRITDLRHTLFQVDAPPEVRFRNHSFHLSDLNAVWFCVEKFTALEGIAHTFLSFEHQTPSGPEYFCVSVEVRREVGETYSPVRGLYRLFEVIYIVGDEPDVIGQRTVLRPQDRVHIYPVNATPTEVQRLFVDIAENVNSLHDRPEFYHTLLKNCTNEIVSHTYELTPEPINWLDPRIVLPGFSGKFAYSQGLVGRPGQTFEELQAECRVDRIAQEVGLCDDFSEQLRRNQPNHGTVR